MHPIQKLSIHLKIITSRILNKPIMLKTKHHPVTIESLKKDGFIITEIDSMTEIKGLTIIDKNNIVKTPNGSISLKKAPKRLAIYQANNNVKHKLEKIKKSTCEIVYVYINTNNVQIADTQNFELMKSFYNEAQTKQIEIKSDKDLYKYILERRIPQIKLIRAKQNYGKVLFKGSSIREFELDTIICNDMSLVLKIETIKDTE